MGAVKVPVDGGGALYKIGSSYSLDEIGDTFRAFVTGYDAVGNFLVIRTAPGNAPGFCAVLDRQGWTEIVGTIAGDDTILVIAQTAHDIDVIVQNLEESLGKDTT
jgi:transcriptional regulator of arginine metabolism